MSRPGINRRLQREQALKKLGVSKKSAEALLWLVLGDPVAAEDR